MKVTIIDSEGNRHRATVAESGEFVTIAACPSCRVAKPAIRGNGISRHDHDTYYASANARCCGAAMRMETKVDTIFGIEEDNAVLNGRPRVY